MRRARTNALWFNLACAILVAACGGERASGPSAMSPTSAQAQSAPLATSPPKAIDPNLQEATRAPWWTATSRWRKPNFSPL